MKRLRMRFAKSPRWHCPATASAMKIFTDINEAEAWLARPLDQIP